MCPIWPDKAQVHPTCLLCLTFNCFVVSGFLANQRSPVAPPYARCTNTAMVWGNLNPPHPTPLHTRDQQHMYVSACFAAARAKLLHRGIDRPYLDFGCSRRTAVCGHLRKSVSVLVSYLCILAEVYRQIRMLLLVWRGVGCGGWRGSPRASAFVWGA